MKEHARGSDVYYFWMVDENETLKEEVSKKDLEEKYAYYYENVRKCQEACDHNIVDGYCFFCNKFFNENENE